PPRAMELAQELVQMQPQNSKYLSLLGIASYRKGDWSGAVNALEKSASMDPVANIATNAFFLCMAYSQLGEKEKARQAYQKAIGWMDDNPGKDQELLRFRAEASALMD